MTSVLDNINEGAECQQRKDGVLFDMKSEWKKTSKLPAVMYAIFPSLMLLSEMSCRTEFVSGCFDF